MDTLCTRVGCGVPGCTASMDTVALQGGTWVGGSGVVQGTVGVGSVPHGGVSGFYRAQDRDTGYRTRDTGFRDQDTGPGYRDQRPGPGYMDQRPGPGTLGPETRDPRTRETRDPRTREASTEASTVASTENRGQYSGQYSCFTTK